MDEWTADKSWYYREIDDPKCKGGKRWKRTKTKGVQGMVVSCSPWRSNLIYEAARNGQAEKVKELSRKLAGELKASRREGRFYRSKYTLIPSTCMLMSSPLGSATTTSSSEGRRNESG